MLTRGFAAWVGIAAGLFTFISRADAGTVSYQPGDIIVVDRIDIDNDIGAIYRVNPKTGHTTELATGGLLADPFDVTFAPNGDLLVVDAKAFGNGGVIRIDRKTGKQTKVASGNLFENPQGIVADSKGNVFVAQDGNNLLRVNLQTGHTQELATFSDSPEKVILDVTGDLLLAQFENAEVDRVNPKTGESKFITSGDLLDNLAGIAVRKDGTILASNVNGSGVVAIDPKTGEQRFVTQDSFGSFDIALLNDSQAVLFSDSNQLERLNINTGAHTVIGDVGFNNGLGLAVVPGAESNLIPLPAAVWTGGVMMVMVATGIRIWKRGSVR